MVVSRGSVTLHRRPNRHFASPTTTRSLLTVQSKRNCSRAGFWTPAVRGRVEKTHQGVQLIFQDPHSAQKMPKWHGRSQREDILCIARPVAGAWPARAWCSSTCFVGLRVSKVRASSILKRLSGGSSPLGSKRLRRRPRCGSIADSSGVRPCLCSFRCWSNPMPPLSCSDNSLSARL